jgi:uncharacterized protein YndB with AHSA1/START domain
MTTQNADPTTVTLDRDARTVTFERVFAAPRTVVFDAFTSCEQLSKWWGPKDWSLPFCRQDFRPGGVWHYGMQGPPEDPQFGGTVAYGMAIYDAIEEPERIAWRDHFADADGKQLPGTPVIDFEVRLEDLGTSTRLISTSIFSSVEDFDATHAMGMVEGYKMTLDRLDQTLAA